MIPEAVGFRMRASHKRKVLKTIVCFWMMKTLSDGCVDTDVVNRVEGMIPEVVGLRGVDDYVRTGSDCTKVTRKHVGARQFAREVFRYGPLIVLPLSLYEGAISIIRAGNMRLFQKVGVSRSSLLIVRQPPMSLTDTRGGYERRCARRSTCG